MVTDTLLLVGAAIRAKRERHLVRRYSLQVTEFQVLRLIVLAGGWLPTSVAGELLQVQLPRITVIARQLEQDGWIFRERIPHDRRSFAMILAEGRRKDVTDLMAEIDVWEKELEAILSPAEASLTAALHHLGVQIPDEASAPLL